MLSSLNTTTLIAPPTSDTKNIITQRKKNKKQKQAPTDQPQPTAKQSGGNKVSFSPHLNESASTATSGKRQRDPAKMKDKKKKKMKKTTARNRPHTNQPHSPNAIIVPDTNENAAAQQPPQSLHQPLPNLQPNRTENHAQSQNHVPNQN